MLLFLSPLGFAQSNTTSGPCSPIAPGNRGSIVIECPGLSKEHADELLKIVNRILENQLDPVAVLAKLDEMHRDIREVRGNQGWRELTKEELSMITATVRAFAGQKSHIEVLDPGTDAGRLAKQLSLALRSAKWESTVTTGFRAYGSEPPVGIVLKTSAAEADAAFSALGRTLLQIFGKPSIQFVRAKEVPSGLIKIDVFGKPL